MESKKAGYTRGFRWGKREHRLEGWTNGALCVTVVLFILALYRHSWFLMYFVFGWLLISLGIHLLARFCHGREKKWHNRAHH